MRRAKQILAILSVLALAGEPASAIPAAAGALLAAYPAAVREAVLRGSRLIGAEFTPAGTLRVARKDALSGETSFRELSAEQARTVLLFLARLPKDAPETGLALALQSYLAPHAKTQAELENPEFFRRDEKGRLVLTEKGRTFLADILTASDGQLLEPFPKQVEKGLLTAAAGKDGRDPSGSLSAVRDGRAARQDPSASFDGAANRLELEGFDWNELETELASAKAGGLNSFAGKSLAGYVYNKEKGTLEMMVAADREGGTYFKSSEAKADSDRILDEAGLDKDLVAKHGGKVVGSVRNLITIEVPLPSAAGLGRELQARGIESRPARMFRSSVAAAAGSPATSFLGQFSPVPTAALEALAKQQGFSPTLARGGQQVHRETLNNALGNGRGATIGIVDSGIDAKHEDFLDAEGRSRVKAYMDFTGEGEADTIGHGTHVAGIAAGNGRASGGELKGMAPQANLVIAKVFGSKGEASEKEIVAAMEWARRQGIDLLNLSLGGPGAPNKDPISAMANQMMVKDNVLVVAAAGNEGPFPGSVGSPGNSRYALTVGGVDKDGEPVFFSSRGPVRDENGNLLYAKPDLLAVAGGVDFSKIQWQMIADAGKAAAGDPQMPAAGLKSLGAPAPNSEKCVYAPGIAAPRSSADPDTNCAVAGNPNYRFMSGTSQATPMVTGFAADVIAFVNAQYAAAYGEDAGMRANALQLKAVLMETAADMGKEKETQGSGLIHGERLANTVLERVKRGIPVGNLAYALARRLTSGDLKQMQHQTRYQMTPLGIYDAQTGHLVNDERQLQQAIDEIRRAQAPVVARREPEVTELIPARV